LIFLYKFVWSIFCSKKNYAKYDHKRVFVFILSTVIFVRF
jgi:hypothetical protein